MKFNSNSVSNTYQILRFALSIAVFFFLSVVTILAQAPIPPDNAEKINGVSFLSPKQATLNLEMVASVKESNAEWVAFIPETILYRETLELMPEEENSWWGKTIEGTEKGIELAKKAGLKVMLKPHILLSDPVPVESNSFLNFSIFGKKKTPVSKKDKTGGATWRGDFQAENTADWKTWEGGYETYILKLADLAEHHEVALFCVGTELRESATQRPKFWRQLIKKVRTIYSGKLTYSANWDEYQDITFWKDLDYIGIDAYFPISNEETPQVAQTVANWQPILEPLKETSERYQRKILITEFGYRNVSNAGLEPWTHDAVGKFRINNKAQVNLYEAFFQAFQQEPFIAGSFLWQWVYEQRKVGLTDFSPQGKPGLEVLKRWYGQ